MLVSYAILRPISYLNLHVSVSISYGNMRCARLILCVNGLILTSLLKILEKRIFVVFFETKRRKKLVSNSLLTSTVRTS